MKPSIIKIDRSNSFNVERFPRYIGRGQYIAEQDERSIVIEELRLSSISLLTTIPHGGIYLPSEGHKKKLKSSGQIKLDAKVFEMLWDNQQLIPESWKKHRRISFEGTLFSSKQYPLSSDFLTLHWGLVVKKDQDGLYTDLAWIYEYHSYSYGWFDNERTAVVNPTELGG